MHFNAKMSCNPILGVLYSFLSGGKLDGATIKSTYDKMLLYSTYL